jgi:hypothetical protein
MAEANVARVGGNRLLAALPRRDRGESGAGPERVALYQREVLVGCCRAIQSSLRACRNDDVRG